MQSENKGLTVTIMGRGKKSGCGYTYLIHSYGGTSHTAFRTKEGMRNYLLDTGLRIGKRRMHLYNTWDLTGSYIENMMWGEDEFTQMKASGNYRITTKLSNGSYTTALIEEREDGNVIHYLNPNCNREIHPYRYD
jgi:hypothetical protein